VILLDERLLDELRERHPLQTICMFSSEKSQKICPLAWRGNAEQAFCMYLYLRCLNFRFVDLDFVG
jgi:hypothetical protein